MYVLSAKFKLEKQKKLKASHISKGKGSLKIKATELCSFPASGWGHSETTLTAMGGGGFMKCQRYLITLVIFIK